MILYGRNPVREALRGRRAHTVGEVWVSGGAAREPWLEGVAVRRATVEELEGRCGSAAHQGVCAEAGGYPYVSADELLGESDPLIVALDQVQDPQNLGSICRTAECAGATGVVIPERRAAEVTPAVCKASAGAVEHLRVARVRNVADFLLHARDAGCWSYGASAPVAGGPREGAAAGECGSRLTRGAPRRAADGGWTPRCPTTARTTAAGWSWCSAARGTVCARGWPGCAIS